MFGGSTTFVTSRSIRRGLRRLRTVTRTTCIAICPTPTDKETISRHQLRYDITIIPPLKMGLEFVKKYEHYHPRVNPKLRYTYPEMYEVLEGDAHYLLQRGQKKASMKLFWSRPRAAIR
jgi:oxalate decarboxylase/phosphoglucose isomerase-like protein (cupin superfamily)